MSAFALVLGLAVGVAPFSRPWPARIVSASVTTNEVMALRSRVAQLPLLAQASWPAWAHVTAQMAATDLSQRTRAGISTASGISQADRSVVEDATDLQHAPVGSPAAQKAVDALLLDTDQLAALTLSINPGLRPLHSALAPLTLTHRALPTVSQSAAPPTSVLHALTTSPSAAFPTTLPPVSLPPLPKLTPPALPPLQGLSATPSLPVLHPLPAQPPLSLLHSTPPTT